MRYIATLTTESRNPESVSKALDVDNVIMKGLGVETRVSGSCLRTVVSSESLSTLLSTLDDLLKCQMMAEGLV